MNHLENDNDEDYECNICYDTPCNNNESLLLECCNRSKRICISCINCLTTPICPYCRSKLPNNCLLYMNETNNISISEPSQSTFTWENFLEEENIINPYLYDDSRRLRRQIRRLRYEYQQRRSNPRSSTQLSRQERRRYNSRRRRNLQLYGRDMMNLYNNQDYNLFPMDDI